MKWKIALVVALATCLAVVAFPLIRSQMVGMYLSDQEQMFVAVNAIRANHGLYPLEMDQRFMDSAQAHAERMFANRRMYHSNCRCLENVAWGFESVDSVMDGWMSSPGHRENILSKRSSVVGCGRAGVYWCLQLD